MYSGKCFGCNERKLKGDAVKEWEDCLEGNSVLREEFVFQLKSHDEARELFQLYNFEPNAKFICHILNMNGLRHGPAKGRCCLPLAMTWFSELCRCDSPTCHSQCQHLCSGCARCIDVPSKGTINTKYDICGTAEASITCCIRDRFS